MKDKNREYEENSNYGGKNKRECVSSRSEEYKNNKESDSKNIYVSQLDCSKDYRGKDK